jgi:AGCS family alanine or glycine:cation symporter
VIIITNNHINQGVEGITLTSQAFGQEISWFPYLLALAVILFAYSTMISWSYYGLKAWTFMFGDTKTSELSYKSLFLVHVILGAGMSLNSVIGFSDAMIFAMSFANVAGMFILAPEVRADLTSYLARIKDGTIKRYK